MATFLFWNINNKFLVDEIACLCHDNNVDVLILAESKIPEVRILRTLNKGRDTIYLSPFNPSPRISYFIRYPEKSIKPIYDDGGISVRLISPPIGLDIIVVALHLPSKLHMRDEDQVFYSVRVIKAINFAETKLGHSNLLVIGDLNMNPFESPVVASDGLHAVMDKEIAKRGSRIVEGKKREFFYNPMWGRMGDTSVGPPGTYFYSKGIVNYFWHTFDQVLIRPKLLDYFSDDQLHVLTNAGGQNLLSTTGISSSFSDHLPIMLTLNIEKEV